MVLNQQFNSNYPEKLNSSASTPIVAKTNSAPAVVEGLTSSSNTTTITATWATTSMQGNWIYVPNYGTAIIIDVTTATSFTIDKEIGAFENVTSYVGGSSSIRVMSLLWKSFTTRYKYNGKTKKI